MTNATFEKYYKNESIQTLVDMARSKNKALAMDHEQGKLLDVKAIPTSMKVEAVKKDKKTGAKTELGYSIYDKNGTMYASLFSQTFTIGWKEVKGKDGKVEKRLALVSTRNKDDYTDKSKKVVDNVEKEVRNYITALGLDHANYQNFLDRYKSFIAKGLHEYRLATEEKGYEEIPDPRNDDNQNQNQEEKQQEKVTTAA